MALIERDVLIKRFCGHCIDYGKCIEKCFDVEIIESIPPVDAVPVRHGKWISNSPVTMRCNQCTYVASDWIVHEFHYCPNCGARMDEE